VKKILPSKGLETTFVNMELEFIEDQDLSTGTAILEFTTAEAARNAQDKLDGYDKIPKVLISAVTFETFNDVVGEKDTLDKVNILQRTEVFGHLEDNFKRDQFAVLVNETDMPGKHTIDLYWHNDVEGNAEVDYTSEFLDSTNIQFSGSGAYIASFHKKGVDILGGKQLSLIRSIEHFGVKSVRFSPNDNYVATYNGTTGPVNGA
jgi:translation initiation factor 3 subunit B